MAGERVLIVDDEQVQRGALRELLLDWGYDVVEAATGEQALEAYRLESPEAVLLDLRLAGESGLDVLRDLRLLDSDAAVIMISGRGDLDDAVAGFRLGLVDYFVKPVDVSALRVALRYRLETRRLESEVRRWRQRDAESVNDALVGTSPALARAFAFLRKVAASDATAVLLQGESGTGKDLFAKALHYASQRVSGPFLAVRCTAATEAALDAEIFGHDKGAFPDAHTMKRGAFELADQGTLYLDEIADLSLSLQARLLHAIETRTVRRRGGNTDIPVDTRVVAASGADLDAAIAAGRVRPDLYYQLAVFRLTLPPLRERREDIPALVDYFVRQHAERAGHPLRGVSPEAMAAFCQYGWPGNVRELRTVVERALILEDGELLTTRYLHLPV